MAEAAAAAAAAADDVDDVDEDQRSDDDTFRIMVATDCHLGYLEKDPVRGNDSFKTFEEILILASDRQVDFVLLGGDLFHDNKPSRQCMHRTIETLRRYTMGDAPVQFQILSDTKINFPFTFSSANYEDPNYNVEMPVFSIHGNHDDPSGTDRLAALDLLQAANLVNYFGKSNSADDITISPILMQKGDTKLAIYGLGSVRDERLHRTFASNKVRMKRPAEDADEWYNLFVLHQNRVKHGEKNYIPEKFLPNFLDMVIWGHEHRCEIAPERGPNQNFFITQPGSSIATSLSDGEAVTKHVALMQVNGKKFMFEKLPLKTVRPFVMEEVALADQDLEPTEKDKIEEFLMDKVQDLVDKANRRQRVHEKLLPLVRLKVEYSGGFTSLPSQRFAQYFSGKVANPKDLLLFYKRRVSHRAPRDDKRARTTMDADRPRPEQLTSSRVEDLVSELLQEQPLELLSSKTMSEALKLFVEKEEASSIKDSVTYQLDKKQKLLLRDGLLLEDEADVSKALQRDVAAQDDEALEDALHAASVAEKEAIVAAAASSSAGGRGGRRRAANGGASGMDVGASASDSEEHEDIAGAAAGGGGGRSRRSAASARRSPAPKRSSAKAKPKTSARGRGTATTRGAKATAASKRKRKQASESEGDSDEDGDVHISESDEGSDFDPGAGVEAPTRTVPKRAAASKRRQFVASDSDDEVAEFDPTKRSKKGRRR
eukprot:m.45836 g.45836  ORF g.45836 m.45836 type:complete len:714 (+) comp11810_c0_seq2:129-2270(+)